jgi:predicted nucleotidyltransferase
MNRQDPRKFQDILYPIFKRNKVIKALLFGSLAKGTGTKQSDVDLLIVMKSDKRFFSRYEDFNDVYDVLKGNAVDMLIYTPEELDKISGRSFIKKILSEGKVIYEQ